MIDNKIGNKFGKLTCLEFSHKNSRFISYYKFKCDCGNEIIKDYNEVKRKIRNNWDTKSCGCVSKSKILNYWINKCGEVNKFGLKLLEYIHHNEHRAATYKYLCTCGKTNSITYQNFLKTKSCGCNNQVQLGEIYKNYKVLNIENSKAIVECLICGKVKKLQYNALYKKSNNNCICNTGLATKTYEFKDELKKYRNLRNSVLNRRKRDFNIEFEDFLKIAKQPCNYCGEDFNDKKGKTHGLDRIDSALGYEINNVVASCYTCNCMKNDLNIKDFYKHLERIIKYANNKKVSKKTKKNR